MIENVNLEKFRSWILLVIISLFTVACVSTTAVTNKPITDISPSPDAPDSKTVILPKPDSPSYIHNAAIMKLLDKANTHMQLTRYDRAIQEIERGLSIAPNNPFLWQKMAEVRLRQGQYWQAEQLANKSNTLGRGDFDLQIRNDDIIAESKKARAAQTP